jgi:DNA-nicking Smr family endonuclease
MSKPRAQPHDEDAEETFREAVKDVVPLRDRGRVVHAPRRPAPLPLQRLQDDRRALEESMSDSAAESELESGDALAFVRAGVSPQVLRKLRAGVWSVQDELDLHGSRSEEARALLAEFIGRVQRRGLRCVRVIHGKGRRSPNGAPVLKRKVASWLAQRGDVLAYCEAAPRDGGGGALMVLMDARSAKPAPQEEEPE